MNAKPTYTISGQTTYRDTGNGSRGTAAPGSSGLAVWDAEGRQVAGYERDECRWGGARVFAWFRHDDGSLHSYHGVPADSDARNLREWFKAEALARYGVRFVR
jgi:hypothetical protein